MVDCWNTSLSVGRRADETGYGRIKELIEYAQSKGMEVMTLSQAYAYWHSVYDFQELG